ncbi:MAG: methyltransferase domain-containing protein [Alphaproteobacteria bacterium]|nr:methyltransferase domain-containing protein [Alphaproteobacteria bacterium]
MSGSSSTPRPPDANEHDLFADHEGGDDVPAGDMLAARQVCLNLLNVVLGQKQSLDSALERDDDFRTLPSRDRAFARMLVATTLRRLGQIDDLIAKAENNPTPKNITLKNILRMGVAQIMFMDVPDHAAVDTSVRLADAAEMDRQKGFVNGLLRTMTRSGREWMSKQDEARLNTPEWLLKTWIEDYELRGAANIAKANLAEAPLDITIKNEADRNYWQSNFKATQIGAGTLRVPSGGAVHEREGFDDGMWWVQDASAAIAASLFGDVKDQTVLDLCAAPGGKTMQLAARGAHVIAVDRSAQRMKRLRQNLERVRLGDRVETMIADAATLKPKEPPRFILLDAPCTATGTIRRNPDVPHLKQPEDMERLTFVQANILEAAYNMLAPGGTLIYCTCSLQKVEGEYQILRLFEAHQDAYKVPITADEVGGLDEAVTENGDLRILPCHQAALGGMDGFFIARITKIA